MVMMTRVQIRDLPDLYREVVSDSQINHRHLGLFRHVILQLHGIQADEPRDVPWGHHGDHEVLQRIMWELLGIRVTASPEMPWGEFLVDQHDWILLRLRRPW